MIIKTQAFDVEENELPFIQVSEFSMDSAIEFINKLRRHETNPNTNDIIIGIASYGGEVWPCLAMVEAVNNCSKPVHAICQGLCASAGAILFCSATGIRCMTKNSRLMFHNMKAWTRSSIPNQEKDVKDNRNLNDLMMQIICDRAAESNAKNPITVKELKKLLDKEKDSCYLSFTKAKSYGLVDVLGAPTFTKTTTISMDV